MSKKMEQQEKQDYALGKDNYRYMIIGFAIIIIGFILMIGGKAETPDQFNEEIFNFRRITLAPILVLFGFLFEIFAIMVKPKEE